jgi:cyclic beta-1,2-glucan synthetase
VHGLPLMGSGDWNDGMNRVGTRARRIGLAGLVPVPVVAEFAPLARAARRHGRARAGSCAAGLAPRCRARPGTAQWYRRAFFDDGQPLGSQRQRRMPHRPDRAGLGGAVGRGAAGAQQQAMASAEALLVDPAPA